MQTQTQQAIHTEAKSLLERFMHIRSRSEEICAPLQPEDYVVQPVVDVSPPKWHLGHTTWFFEEFVLDGNLPGYKRYNEQFAYVFNSYYETVGKRILRTNRGNLTRPSVEEVYRYRSWVYEHMERYLQEEEIGEEMQQIVELGLQHEQQHQELLIYDIKYILGNNPLLPAYAPRPETAAATPAAAPEPLRMLPIEEGVYEIGWQHPNRFCFDNELGRHKVYLQAYSIANRLVTNREYLEFMEAGGYGYFRHWLSEAWEWVKQEKIAAPYHWHKVEGAWHRYTMHGLEPLNLDEPVTHISFYEADAFAKWKGLRLPTEQEWEVACLRLSPEPPATANFQESRLYEPAVRATANLQFWGDAWEWTASAYRPYPYFSEAEGAVGEYNGKFMINQMVLRGGSCATPRDHIRATYRNFFNPHLRWMYSGIRLAQHI
ncbi:ergothioneine biosynthesis protein EgtB [Cesiribacter sp. SM1]|uniref:ergothioneine biosynthesis protein EgtB n=1 Tax=Cesiribacter sp. SM1 TaxID=2861196 RepID=UPI001CD7DFAB|nr:ergothioneine biosynthesis protein EgtB [Cesiribacter sp. SM1]